MELWSLRLLRVVIGLQQRDLAKSAGFDQTYISLLENGTPPRSAADISTLARSLGVTKAVLTAKALTITQRGKVRVARDFDRSGPRHDP